MVPNLEYIRKIAINRPSQSGSIEQDLKQRPKRKVWKFETVEIMKKVLNDELTQ